VDGDKVKLNQPLRLDFPVVDGSYAQVFHPVTKCGIEDLTLEQTENLWISGIHFARSWNCWAQNVKVIKTGRHPLYPIDSKFAEIRDCVFDDAQFKGGGGSAYAGFERSYDCLMDHVEVTNIRHGPIVNWACSGDVVRNSTFKNLNGGHWHSGYCNENLYENCEIDSTGRAGMMVFGPRYFKIHGPLGPRNVLYNCDVSANRNAGNDMGVWLMGHYSDAIFVYNRFAVKSGIGMTMEDHTTNQLVRGNVFCLEHAEPALVVIKDPTCTGIKLIDNQVFGDVKAIASSTPDGFVDQGNTVAPYQLAPRPTPPVPSIFEWERQQHMTAKQ